MRDVDSSGQSILTESPTEATEDRIGILLLGKKSRTVTRRGKLISKMQVNQNQVRGTNGRLPVFQSIQSLTIHFDMSLGQHTGAYFLEEGLAWIPVIKNSRALLFSLLMTQQRKKKTEQNIMDSSVGGIAKGRS